MGILVECPICHRKQSTRNKHCAACGDHLDKQKRNGKARFWVIYRIGGKERKEFAGYSIQGARDAEGKRKGQKAEGRILDVLPQSHMTFQELSDWYLSNMTTEVELTEAARVKGKTRKGPSRSYLSRVRSSLNMFNAALGDMVVGNVSYDDLKSYCNRRESTLSPNTLDIEMKIIKGMINQAFDADKIDGRVLKAFRRVKGIATPEDKTRKRSISLLEYRSLLEAAPSHIKAMLVIGMNTGMRHSEIRNLRWSHIDRASGVIRLPAEITKTRHPRVVPMTPQVKEAINSLPRHLHGFVITFYGKPLVGLTGVKKGLLSVCKSAGVPYGRKQPNGIIFHDLRRTAKTNMLRAGVGKEYRDLILGHSLKGMDQHYISEDQLEKELIHAMGVYGAWLESQMQDAAQNAAQKKL